MDWLVLPGYTSLGYDLRRRLEHWGPPDPEGRAVMVTGATSGIGAAACERLAARGAAVHMVVRDRERGERVRERIAAAGPGPVELHLCDVSSLASVRELAAGLDPRLRLDALVNNAGVLPPARTHTEEGFELTFATNALGPFLLTALLLPALRRAAPSRAISVTSGGMYTAKLDLDDLQLERREFDGARFYAHTKRIEVILAEEWSRRLAGEGVRVDTVHPGWVATPGVSSSLPRFEKLMRPLLRSPEAGADTIVWLAAEQPASGPGGELWHDRHVRPKHRVPWTREDAAERTRLFDECERLCGLPPGGATEGAASRTESERKQEEE
jgi:NAD(P)-dependent dehydrogenase (short-subunit alcohol dehydrogenase family)